MTSVVHAHLAINHRYMMSEKTGLDSARLDDFNGRVAIVEAYCRAQRTSLPRGGRGVCAAMDILGAFTAACRLGWTDMTVSAPQLFRMLHHAELISGIPTACDMPAALRLVGSVCELVEQRSARRWTVWFGRACDPENELFSSIRGSVTSDMIRRPPAFTPTESAPRTSSIRAERDQLASDLAQLKEELASANSRCEVVEAELGELARQREAYAALRGTHTEVVDERNELRRDLDRACRSRDKLRFDLDQAVRQASQLRAAMSSLEENRKALLADNATLKVEVERREQRIKLWRDDFKQVLDSAVRDERALREIQEIFELDEVSPEDSAAFIAEVEHKYNEAKEYAQHVAVVCARALDEQISECMAAMVRLSLNIRRGTDPDGKFRKQLPETRRMILEAANQVRAKLEVQGVFLPPARAYV